MPNRMIKDSIHSSEKVNAMTDFQFRVWVSLITYVDDYGRGDARAAIIKGTCFPLRDRLTNKDIENALAGLAGIGCIGLYTVDGRPYLYFPNWEQHQVIRNKRSKFPAPDNLNAIESNCNQLNANVSVIQSNPNTNPNPNMNITRHKYGEYDNVLLSDDDMNKLKAEFPNDYESRIERLSSYKASTGKVYKNDLATIRNWAKKDDKPTKEIEQPKPQAGDLERMRRLIDRL